MTYLDHISTSYNEDHTEQKTKRAYHLHGKRPHNQFFIEITTYPDRGERDFELIQVISADNVPSMRLTTADVRALKDLLDKEIRTND